MIQRVREIRPVRHAGQVQPVQGRMAAAPGAPARNYDKVDVSESTFQKQLLGRLSQEVRAASTTTGTVAALRGQVEAGEYEVDPRNIARRLLFVWES